MMPFAKQPMTRTASGSKPPQQDLWKWGLAFQMVFLAVLIGNAIDIEILSESGKTVSEANFAFRQTYREVRRSQTPGTYNQERGQLLKADLKGFDPLNSEGVTDLEDSMGGLLSGPTKLWLHGEILVHERTKAVDPTLTLRNIRAASQRYWTNHNEDACEDREITLSGQRISYGENADHSVIIFGFLEFNCSSGTQHGYLSKIYSAYHGGPMTGRIYKMSASFGLNDFGRNESTYNSTVPLELHEIGAFIEDRGFASRLNLELKASAIVIPVFLWLFFVSRVSNVRVILNSVISPSSQAIDEKQSSSTLTTKSTSNTKVAPGILPSVTTNRMEKEFKLEGYIDVGAINTLKWPFLYLCMTIVLPILMLLKDDTGLRVIQEIEPNFRRYGVNYFGCWMWVVSQELFFWIIFFFTYLLDKDQISKLNRNTVYAYQRADFSLRLIGMLNMGTATFVLFDFFKLIPNSWIIYMIVSILIFFLHGYVVIFGIRKDRFEMSNGCTVAAMRKRVSLSTRGLSILLAQQVSNKSKRAILQDEIMGMSYKGKVSDAIFLCRPEYFLEAFMNGHIMQFKMEEKAMVARNLVSKIVMTGERKFRLTRYWRDQGKSETVVG